MPSVRILGVDLGEKRVGVALSDETGTIASPLGVIERVGDRTLVIDLKRLVREHGVGSVVVGLPVHMDGREGPEAEHARKVAALLSEKAGVPVELWDERLSTVQAQRAVRASGKRRRRPPIDAVAAALILQSFLDAQRPRPWPAEDPEP
ncbi:MAG: Holliday junction resolvase RuvX [Deltaproteobacteria bacterium]|nr:Holliday junction resolvase RuvX [Deltaproteobacteria bacterium]